ncbi:xanthine dehydrogenase small subunit [Thioalkalivibrio sp. HK1]|uniref:xanthine dehydrogenase small subunit n=1 Tax=Thioalkalivibrio sp. HK1 TaxID=1469245 RepID=UPI000471C471|nr:xanthine dehydrogenase small subunit [Thioalkalivibrio sp. HK1]
MRNHIRFIRKGQIVELSDVSPTETLLDYLRLRERSCGTKEGCAEGDCGACTVAVGRLRAGRIVYEPINSCIALLGMMDGLEIVTVDDLAPSDEHLHPVQSALVSAHASQCGFCTPGFVMSLFALYHSRQRADRSLVNDWLAGNLCRCTGYRPIADAALAACTGEPDDAFSRRSAKTHALLESLIDDHDIRIGDDESFFAAPASEDALVSLLERHKDATIVGGATDVGLWITKQLRSLPQIVHTGRVASMHEVIVDDDRIEIGGAVTYAEAEAALARIDPDIEELLRRLGSKQVRSLGTIGGNIANGSPIGDSPPWLIVLGAQVELRRGDARRRLPLEDFFIDYGRQDRALGEILLRIVVPRPAANEHFRCYKISKRFDQDISAVLGAFLFRIEKGRVVHARMALGGMAAIPKRAFHVEGALVGCEIDDPDARARAMDLAAKEWERDFSPIDDHRASAAYRLQVSHSLLTKALNEVADRPTSDMRLIDRRDLHRIEIGDLNNSHDSHPNAMDPGSPR